METSYTAKMESELDEITLENDSRSKVLNEFYNQFESLYEVACKEMEKSNQNFQVIFVQNVESL